MSPKIKIYQIKKSLKTVVTQEHKSVIQSHSYTLTRRLRVRSLLEEINYYHHRHSTRSASKNSAQSGERSVLTLGILCLPYCMLDTAQS